MADKAIGDVKAGVRGQRAKTVNGEALHEIKLRITLYNTMIKNKLSGSACL